MIIAVNGKLQFNQSHKQSLKNVSIRQELNLFTSTMFHAVKCICGPSSET